MNTDFSHCIGHRSQPKLCAHCARHASPAISESQILWWTPPAYCPTTDTCILFIPHYPRLSHQPP